MFLIVATAETEGKREFQKLTQIQKLVFNNVWTWALDYSGLISRVCMGAGS
jgi:hypothetical protein